MLKVLKFGGSSLADSSQFAKVKEIVESDSSREVVIVSAPGKRNSDDNKITDLLYLTHAHLRYGVDYEGVLSMIKKRYVEIKKGCGLETDIASIIDETFAAVDKRTPVDFLASRGEYFSAILMADYLGYQFVDAVDWLCFEYNGKVNAEKSEQKLRELKSKYDRIVTPGFYGALPSGDIRVFPRGGSDITGALAAAYLGADVYENWTDVSGILMVDPRIVKDPKTIARVTFDELRELSYMGASVLHEDTVFPVRIRDIPVNIRNTNEPDNPGTIIREHFEDELEEETERFITGIAGKRNFSIISIYKSRMGEEKLGLLRQVLEVFAQYEIPVEQIPSGVDSFSVVFPSGSIGSRKHELMQELSEFEGIDNCTLTEGVSLIAIVGRQMAYRIGISGKIFKTLGENKINIRTIEQCADEINIMVGVYDEDFDRAIRVLYESFAK
ncbi:MAG: aspartate kinase [Mogibacterium sp.]|nr:aspartate kinase [Mogibacterium sp.]MBR2390049.1 aspartate kinase [Mogibacterium sp.]